MKRLLLACSLLGLLVLIDRLAAAEVVTEPFQGVRHIHRIETAPRELSIHIIEIDLSAPGIAFRLTPPNGEDTPGEHTQQTTRDFLVEQRAQIAINASFFYYSPEAPYTKSRGLVVCEGVKVSPFDADGRPWPALNIGRDNNATIVDRAHSGETFDTIPRIDPYNAVSGNERIVIAGRNTAGRISYGQGDQLHPRTAAGITQDGRLLLVTVDGRNPGHSRGMTTPELADLMIEYGVREAINLDGGGSTTLVMADPAPRVVNVPVGVRHEPGSERRNGTNLAVFARPRPVERPAEVAHRPAPQERPAPAQPQPPAAAPAGQANLLDDFSTGMGRFNRALTHSGQTVNVSRASTVTRDSSRSVVGGASQKLTIRRDPADARNWRVRHISGDADPANNLRINVSPNTTDGYIGFYMRTTTPGIKATIVLDNNANVIGTMVGGVQREITADGQWHLYEWNLDDRSHWAAVEGIGGDGVVSPGWVSVDSIMLYGGATDAEIWLDAVAHNPAGSLSDVAERRR